MTEASASKGSSVLKRFNWILIIIYLVTVAASVPLVYLVTRQQAMTAAEAQLSLLVDMVTAVRKYVSDDLRPTLLQKQVMHPPAVSSTVATAVVARYFAEKQPGYYIKIASDNPLNPKNKAQPFEQSLLERFRGDKELKAVVEAGHMNGQSYLVSARPSKSTAECLLCHGDPAAVPVEITSVYPASGSGYQYRSGTVVGVTMVGVPIGNINAIAIERAGIVIGILTVIFGLLMVAINITVRRHIITPILQITESAKAVSLGDLERKISLDRKDEIGELARSFELMRRSLVTVLRRMKS